MLGSGAIPLATAADRRALVAAAGAGQGRAALVNNRFSADVLAIAAAETLAAMPDLATDNALPRWLAEAAGYEVSDLRRRWRLGIDIDGPLDLVLIGPRSWLPAPPPGAIDRVTNRLAARAGASPRDPRAELVLAGRTSAAGLAWLERRIAARTRALVEERGLRTAVAGQRPPRSVSRCAARARRAGRSAGSSRSLATAALVDSRVLLAHRLGGDDTAWPAAADRFASDLLLHEAIEDPWLRDLTRSAADAPIPIVLGGHTLVGPGLRLALGRPG